MQSTHLRQVATLALALSQLVACSGETGGTPGAGMVPQPGQVGDGTGTTGTGVNPGALPTSDTGPGLVPGNPVNEPGLGPSASACATGLDAGVTPLTRLTSQQYQNSVRRLLGVDIDVDSLSGADERGGAFVANVSASIGELVVEQYKAGAEAAAAMADLPSLLPCATQDEACARQFIVEVGARAYRRPLTEAQISALLGVFAVGDDFQGGVRLVLEAILQSPHFIYHVEDYSDPGQPVRPLDGYSLAARLSFALQNTIPDDELFQAGASGELLDPVSLRAHAERLIQTEEGGVTIADFHTQWLGLSELERASKDEALFPDFDDAMKRDMLSETRRFADYVVRYGDSRFETLFNAPYTFLEGSLFELYGIAEPPAHDPLAPLALTQEERGGLLTQAAYLALHSHANQSSPILRGTHVRESLLCQTLPDPPPDVDDTPPTLDPDATTRERFAQHTEDAACAGCHALIDPIGLGFENYDAIGRFRREENGQPIDASGEVLGLGSAGQTFDGVRQLSQLIATSPQAQDCMATQWFQYLLSRPEHPADACSSESARAAFEGSDFNIRELILSIVTSDSFRHTKGQSL